MTTPLPNVWQGGEPGAPCTADVTQFLDPSPLNAAINNGQPCQTPDVPIPIMEICLTCGWFLHNPHCCGHCGWGCNVITDYDAGDEHQTGKAGAD